MRQLTGDRTDCQIFIINIGSVCIKFTTHYAFRLRNVTKVSFACSPKIHNQQNIKFYANKLAKKTVLLLRKILRLVWSCTPTEKNCMVTVLLIIIPDVSWLILWKCTNIIIPKYLRVLLLESLKTGKISNFFLI